MYLTIWDTNTLITILKNKHMKNLGIVLIVIGIVLAIYTGFTFFTKEKVVDLGPVEINKEKPHHINWSPILGIVLIGVGGLIVWQSNKNKV